MKEKIKGLEESARLFVEDKEAEIDIPGYVTMIVSIMVGGIIIGVLMVPMSDGLTKLTEAVPDLEGLINAIPLLVVLAFVVGIVFWAIKSFEKQ